MSFLRTSHRQEGFIRVVSADTLVKDGTLWDFITYVKADHFIRGLSLIIGYSYNQKDPTSVRPFSGKHDLSVISGDPTILLGWNMHVINFFGEYDWSNEDIIRLAPAWQFSITIFLRASESLTHQQQAGR